MGSDREAGDWGREAGKRELSAGRVRSADGLELGVGVVRLVGAITAEVSRIGVVGTTIALFAGRVEGCCHGIEGASGAS